MISILKMNEQFHSYSHSKINHKSTKSINSTNSIKVEQEKNKIKKLDKVYPKSTQKKIIFIFNSQGNCFVGQKVPKDIQLMKKQIDDVCYSKWKDHKQRIQKQPLNNFHRVINFLYAITLILIAVLFTAVLGQQDWDSFIQAFVWVGLVLIIVSTAISLLVYSQQMVDDKYSDKLVRAIKNKLAGFNTKQKIMRPNSPRFEWSCNKVCSWIAVEYLNSND